MLSEYAKGYFKSILEIIARPFVKADIHPNYITLTGFILTVFGAVGFAYGRFLFALVFWILGGACDMLDGVLARLTNKLGPHGAFLDSTLDRYSEIATHLGLLVYFSAASTGSLYPILIMLSLGGSLMVSYVKARAEGLGQECHIGLMERPERVILVLIGTLCAIFWGDICLKIIIWLLAIGVHFTALQRVYALKNQFYPKAK